MLADVVFGLRDSGKFFTSVDVESGLGLAQVRLTFHFIEFRSHFLILNF